MVILVEVFAWLASRSVSSDDDVDGADADTLLTTEDTMERSTTDACQLQRIDSVIGRTVDPTFLSQGVQPRLRLRLLIKVRKV